MVLEHPEDTPKAFEKAWNGHDMRELGALFCGNATFVNRFGHYVRGVDEIIELHRSIHETIYSDSILKNDLIDTVPLGKDVAVVHFWSRLVAGPAHPVGPHAVDTLILAVLVRKNRQWLIQALENVTVTNPRTGEAVLRS